MKNVDVISLLVIVAIACYGPFVTQHFKNKRRKRECKQQEQSNAALYWSMRICKCLLEVKTYNEICCIESMLANYKRLFGNSVEGMKEYNDLSAYLNVKKWMLKDQERLTLTHVPIRYTGE